MRRIVSVVALMSLWGCGADHGPEGSLVKPGTGVVGVPGGGYGLRASRAVPVSGGTLLVTRDGIAVAADPDRDRVFLANIGTDKNVRTVALQPGDEPGRVAEDDAGRVHVAARTAGVVVSIDLASAKVIDRRAVCPAPRGIAHDSATGLLHVACQTGELVSLPAAGGEAVRVLKLNRDLRDVLVRGNQLLVSRFKTAQMLLVDENGRVTNTVHAPTSNANFAGGLDPTGRTPSVAWRMVALPNGKVGMLHQRGTLGMVSTSPSGYGGGFNPCGSGAVVDGTLSQLTVPDPEATTPPQDFAAAPINAMVGPSDVAASPSGKVAVVSIGNAWFAPPPSANGGMPEMSGPMRQRKPKIAIVDPGAGPPDPSQPPPCDFPSEDAQIEGEPTAVAFDQNDRIVIQSREPAQLQVLGPNGFKIALSADSRADTGLALFHMDAGPGLACASCHPEGMEDGRVWEFAGLGSRRTQNLGGGIMNTVPFHWAGDLADFQSLVHEVFESRMGSARPNHLQLEAFGKWIDSVPAVIPALTDSSVVERGRALFDSAQAGCSTCHSGAQFTNNQTVDVGTGGFFQVPSLLGVGSRAPFMHTGCAPTLRDRFGACGGGDLHGTTSSLNAAQVDDLVAYLESL
jgi:hypothetical protein